MTTPPTTIPGNPSDTASFSNFAMNHDINGLWISGHLTGTCPGPVAYTVGSASGNLALDGSGDFVSARLPVAEGPVQAVASACGATSSTLGGTNYGTARLAFSPDTNTPVGFRRQHYAITSGNPAWTLEKATVQTPDWCAGRINTSGKPVLTVDPPANTSPDRDCTPQVSAIMHVTADPAVNGMVLVPVTVHFVKSAL